VSAQARFERALALVLVHEGGFVNHPDDPGGATNFGITQNTFNHWRRGNGQEPRSVRHISQDEVRGIYRAGFWDSIRAEEMPEGVAYAVFDAAVNSGPGRAIRWLQAELGARQDGVVGPETISKLMQAEPVALVNSYCDRRLRFMQSLRHWPTFGRGWSRRVAEVRRQAVEWALIGRAPDSVVEAPGRADRPDDQGKPLSQSRTVKGGATAAAGGVGVAISDAVATIEPLASTSDALRWVFVALVIAGAAWAVYARVDDAKHGRG
jgi:lysozyme family protein